MPKKRQQTFEGGRRVVKSDHEIHDPASVTIKDKETGEEVEQYFVSENYFVNEGGFPEGKYVARYESDDNDKNEVTETNEEDENDESEKSE